MNYIIKKRLNMNNILTPKQIYNLLTNDPIYNLSDNEILNNIKKRTKIYELDILRLHGNINLFKHLYLYDIRKLFSFIKDKNEYIISVILSIVGNHFNGNTSLLCCVENQTDNICKMFIDYDPCSLLSVKNLTDNICKYTIEKYKSPILLGYMRNRKEKFRRLYFPDKYPYDVFQPDDEKYITFNIYKLKNIIHTHIGLTKLIIMEHIKRYPRNIGMIEFQDEEICNEVIKRDPEMIMFVLNKNKKIMNEFIKYYDSYTLRVIYYIDHPILITNKEHPLDILDGYEICHKCKGVGLKFNNKSVCDTCNGKGQLLWIDRILKK